MDLQIGEEEINAAFMAFTNSEEAERPSALASGPDLDFSSSGNYDMILDGGPSSLVGETLEETPLGFMVLQGNLQQGQQCHASNLMPAFENPGSRQSNPGGLQDNVSQGQASNSSSVPSNLQLTPDTPDRLQEVSPGLSAPAPLPPAPTGINPTTIADALQVATTAAATSETQIQPAVSQRTHFLQQSPQPQPQPAPQLSLPPQQYIMHAPPPPVQETLSDFPHLHRTHHTTGYRDGLSYAHATAAQPSFDAGFPLGIAQGLRAGRALGVIEFAAAGVGVTEVHEVYQRAQIELDTRNLIRDFVQELRSAGWGVYQDSQAHPQQLQYPQQLQQQQLQLQPRQQLQVHPQQQLSLGPPRPPQYLPPTPSPGPGEIPAPSVMRWGPPPTPGMPWPENCLSVDEALNRWEAYARMWVDDKSRQGVTAPSRNQRGR
jgi:hypothetical protein